MRVCLVKSHSVAGRRLVILADGHLDTHFGKTAIGILRYRAGDVVAVIDRESAGKSTQEAVGVGGSAPIVASLDDALERHPDALLLGVATRGGAIPDEWRPVLRHAISSGLDVIGGLHEFLNDDPELASLARASGVQLIDVRKPPERLSVASGRPHRAESIVITIVGSDCAVGKMSVSLDIEAEARRRGIDAQFVATGQTGMMIAGNGVPVDRVIGDFMAGAVEEEVVKAAERHDVVLVEGQGSLVHPGYSGVTLALIHGSRPDAMILTVMPGRKTIDEYEVEIPPVLELREIHEAAAGWLSPAPVIGIGVNCMGLDPEHADHVVESISVETGLPAADTFRQGASALVDAIDQFVKGRDGLLDEGVGRR
jgi:uncharacterized NAD-dependent epimerase/dehydratase family protein